ncbi:TIGR02234 family membrane protein [Mycobacterium yunnanensis]|uniref:TIGR02234 family membrane protein n=1 Tax=Mycobacterium yunnanensis TaxID=368477 RepID=A0A9X3C2J2_9MYCO|nr:TIGR02234 family membrane protein [Mycobacterium yunnanensis]MCV7422783.1 TIGR02234 family membrane protein [Mycobacterium yunnanensis]
MIRVAQLLLVASALALWVASRMTWVDVTSFDGLGQPKTTTLDGATWSTALVPLALVSLAAAVAVLAVRGWVLRLVGLLVALATVAMGYLGIGLWVVPDVAARAADLAQIPVTALIDTQRHHTGAVVTLVAAVSALAGAVLLVRSAARATAGAKEPGKYLAPAAKREAARQESPEDGMSERMIWDALDEGRDPTREHDEGR